MSEHAAKVLFVMNVPMTLSGITLSTILYVEGMDRARVHADFVAIEEPPREVRARVEAIGSKIIVISGRLRHPLAYVARLARAARGYEIMHVKGNSCTMALDLLAGFLAGVRVRIAHSHNTSCRYKFAHKILRPLFEMVATERYACSEDAGKWLFRDKPFHIARVAIDTEKFRFDPRVREETRAELGVGEVTLLGCVANFNPAKNHAFLIDAFAEYHKIDPSAKLALVGGGSMRADVEARARRLGVYENIMFLGRRPDVARLVQAFDIALLPSLYEGFPNVLLEFQCAGLVSLASDTITRGVDITGLVKFLPISAGAKPWSESLVLEFAGDRAARSAEAIEKIRAAGHDIAINSRQLQEFYISKLN